MPIDIGAIAPGVNLAADGIWYGADAKQVSYPDTGNEAAFAIEDDSFWFLHRNNCIATVANRFPPLGPIFDVGGGNGFVTRGLISAGFDAILVEPGQVGALNGRRRGIRDIICATTDTAQFKPRSLPAVGMFDVIEHIDDDLSFLKSIRSLMRDDGMLYATVPAYSALWSEEDDYAGHFRRHTMSSIKRTVERAGFKVEFSSYIFRFLPLPILLLRALPYRLGIKRPNPTPETFVRDHATNGGFIADVLAKLLESEVKNLSVGRTMQFGGSILVAARC